MTDVPTAREALPREAVTDGKGQLTRSWRNYFEAGSRRIGEIISGVNLNRQSIVDLGTSVTTELGTLEAAIESEATVRASGDTANATLVTTLEASITVGTNECYDPLFGQRATAWNNVRTIFGMNWSTVSVATQGADKVIEAVRFATPTSGDWCDLGQTQSDADLAPLYMAVTAGDRVEASVYAGGASLSQIALYVDWLDDAGDPVGDTLIQIDTTPALAAGDHTTMDRLGGFATAPSGARYAALFVRAFSNGTFGPILKYTRPYIGKARANQTALSQWSQGVGRSQASVTVTSSAVADIEGRLSASYAIQVDGGGNGALVSLEDGTELGSVVKIAADKIELRADALDLGTDTTFEATHDTFYTVAGSYRFRYGGPFGTSSDLLQWYGLNSVSLNSETKTNGIFALATDGKVYYGTTELATGQTLTASISPVSASDDRLGAGSITLSRFTVTVSGGVGTIDYQYTPDAGITVGGTDTAPTFTATVGVAEQLVGNVSLRIVDFGNGRTTTLLIGPLTFTEVTFVP